MRGIDHFMSWAFLAAHCCLASKPQGLRRATSMNGVNDNARLDPIPTIIGGSDADLFDYPFFASLPIGWYAG